MTALSRHDVRLVNIRHEQWACIVLEWRAAARRLVKTTWRDSRGNGRESLDFQLLTSYGNGLLISSCRVGEAVDHPLEARVSAKIRSIKVLERKKRWKRGYLLDVTLQTE